MHDRAGEVARLGLVARRRRKELGLTQQETAELAGVAVRTVHAVEAGKATIQLGALLSVLSAVGLQFVVARGSSGTGLVVGDTL